MEQSINKLKYSMNQSRFATIGYKYGNEGELYEFLKNYNPIYINEFDVISCDDLPNSIKMIIRDKTIDRVLSDDEPILMDMNIKNSYVINLNNIYTNSHSSSCGLNRANNINNFVRNLYYESTKNNIKIILLSYVYTNPTSGEDNIRGGSSPLYISDLVSIYKGGSEFNIIKNRYA